MNGSRFTFQQQLFLGFLAVLIVSAGASMVAARVSASSYFTDALQERTETGEQIVRVYLANRSKQLETSVRVLVRDYGFKSAVATNDEATISNVLFNHGNRIGADLAILTDLDGVPLSVAGGASSTIALAAQLPLDPARRSRLAWYGDVLYQTFLQPVEVPEHIGWIVMGFQLGRSEAAEIGALLGIDVAFVTPARQGTKVVASREFADLQLARQSLSSDSLQEHWLRNDHFVTRFFTVEAGPKPILGALRASTDIAREASTQLMTQIAEIFLLALVLCIASSLWLSRKMSNPIAQLIAAARSISQGNYDQPVALTTGGELATLGSALNTMAIGIAEREAQISRYAYEDQVTGLPNLNRLRMEFADFPTPSVALGVALTNGKDIEFSYGPERLAGLQRTFADRVGTELRAVDRCYAAGAEQMVLLLADVSQEESRSIARRIIDRLHCTEATDALPVRAQFVTAIVQYPKEADTLDQLLHRLSVTIERAVEERAPCLTYAAEQEQTRHRQLMLISAFDKALEEGQLQLYYQPKISLSRNAVNEAEALLRWIHPTLGFIPPDEFIVLAERSGNIRRLTSWVLKEAIRQAALWARSDSPVRVAINISAHDLADPALCGEVTELLSTNRVAGSCISLEVTESAVLVDESRAIEALKNLGDMGIQLAVDDYGTGFSSLSQLKKLPVNELKIDKSFIMDLDSSPDDLQIVRSTIDLGHNLGMRIVAEGVETEGSLKLLQRYGCDKAQGYYFAKPMPVVEFQDWCSMFRASGAGDSSAPLPLRTQGPVA